MAEASIVEIWGRICVFNKLLTPPQWAECVAAYTKGGGRTPIENVLLEKKFIKPEHVEVIRKKVLDVVAKTKPAQAGGAAAPAAPARAPAAPTMQAPPAVDSSFAGRAAAAAAAAVPASPPARPTTPARPAAPVKKIDDQDIPLADEQAAKEAREAENWSPSEVDWATEGHDVRKDKQIYDDPALQPIDLETPETTEKDRGNLIIKEDRSIKPVTQVGDGTRPRATLTPPRGPQILASADGDRRERIPCAVPPMTIDPESLGWLKFALDQRASDVHLCAGEAPFYRRDGSLLKIDAPKISPKRATEIALGFMDDQQQQHFLAHHDLDFSLDHPEIGRARVNVLESFHGTGTIFRLIPAEPPTLARLGLPESLTRFTEYTQGLVLVTGPAGCGKSTTAAALVNVINERRKDHIIIVEDPVEFIQHSINCSVTQRQVRRDTESFSTALRAALREAPDVIVIGEMRDLDTVSLAIRAAETGHLVIGTLQTKSAARTIDRIIDVYPSDQQASIRVMLSESLRGIISQFLVPRADGKGRVLALEVLRVTPAISNLIRDSKTFQIASTMQTGKKIGQRLMDESIAELLAAGTITRDDAMRFSENPRRFQAVEATPELELKKS